MDAMDRLAEVLAAYRREQAERASSDDYQATEDEIRAQRLDDARHE